MPQQSPHRSPRSPERFITTRGHSVVHFKLRTHFCERQRRHHSGPCFLTNSTVSLTLTGFYHLMKRRLFPLLMLSSLNPYQKSD